MDVQAPLGVATGLSRQPTEPAKEAGSDAALRDAARALEASFLEVMLKSAGVGETSEAFGGGIGEKQFASFLRQTQAEAMSAAGGVGLADSIFESLKART